MLGYAVGDPAFLVLLFGVALSASPFHHEMVLAYIILKWKLSRREIANGTNSRSTSATGSVVKFQTSSITTQRRIDEGCHKVIRTMGGKKAPYDGGAFEGRELREHWQLVKSGARRGAGCWAGILPRPSIHIQLVKFVRALEAWRIKSSIANVFVTTKLK